MSTVVIMAGGTGGHIYPALAVGAELRSRGVNVYWMGVRSGLEDRLARAAGFEFDAIRIKNLWGKGLIRWLTLPVWLTVSLWQSLGIILNRRPDVMLGMGGYVCGPGGVAAALLRCPLVIHESNAVAGLTNRLLALVATRVLSGVPESDLGRKAEYTGTPVRDEIIAAAKDKSVTNPEDSERLNLLVIGGSQGAVALNQAVPEALKMLSPDSCPNVWHQTGQGRANEVSTNYANLGVQVQVTEYIDDMPGAYQWADVVIARAGAMTIAELSTMGLAAILVPFPFAARNHQHANAQVLVRSGAAILCSQDERFATRLGEELHQLVANRTRVHELAVKIKDNARPDATRAVADCCMQWLVA